jgi:hypothetical protein
VGRITMDIGNYVAGLAIVVTFVVFLVWPVHHH